MQRTGRINWTTRQERVTREVTNLPKAKPVRIRRKAGAGGFWHEGRVVEEGETITCPHDIAETLVNVQKKAEYVGDGQ